VLEKNDNIKRERLKTYFESILLKDVILKNNVRSADKIKDMAYYFLTNVASEYNYNRLAKILDISTLTAESYFSFINDSFLVDSVSIFSYKVKEQLQYPRKIILYRQRYQECSLFQVQGKLGQIYENTVFAELKRKRKRFITGKIRAAKK